MESDIGMHTRNHSEKKIFLEESLIAKEPFGQFKAWLHDAIQKPEIVEANAMCLATASR